MKVFLYGIRTIVSHLSALQQVCCVDRRNAETTVRGCDVLDRSAFGAHDLLLAVNKYVAHEMQVRVEVQSFGSAVCWTLSCSCLVFVQLVHAGVYLSQRSRPRSSLVSYLPTRRLIPTEGPGEIVTASAKRTLHFWLPSHWVWDMTSLYRPAVRTQVSN